MELPISSGDVGLSSISDRATASVLEWFSLLEHWSLVAVGAAFVTVTETVFVVHGLSDPLVHLLKLVVPLLVGVGLIWFGFSLEDQGRTASHVAVISIVVILGMVAFVGFASYLRFLYELEQPLRGNPTYVLLNVMAVGATVNALYATQYVELRRSEGQLQDRNERLVQLASMISHDLRNPLNVAKGHLELAEARIDDEHLATATSALDRMEALIEELLVFTHTGVTDAEAETVPLDRVATESWAVVDTADASLRTEIERTVAADPDRLRHLLENLYRNAIEHGGPAVTVRVGPLEDGDGFYVADDGPGIEPADRSAIFEPGFTTADRGTGLGLNIVREVAEAHGWTVDVTESDAGGARFEISDVASLV
ncbi:MAG: sensor histidine kinase [Halanaeroarchaeum sp.]